MEIVSCSKARSAGSKRYFTGKPCPYGHIGERFVAGRGCIPCATTPRMRVIKNAWNAQHKGAQAVRTRRFYEKNPGKANEAHKRWLERDVENKVRQKQAIKNWQQSNPDKTAAIAARRRSAILQRVPSWADNDEIRKFYRLAQIMSEATGTDYHVDHIYPLQGDRVSGFHAENNLQILEGAINQSKSNKHPEDLLLAA